MGGVVHFGRIETEHCNFRKKAHSLFVRSKSIFFFKKNSDLEYSNISLVKTEP